MLVQDLEPQQRLPEKGVDSIDLEAVPSLELLLQRRFAQLRLDVEPLVLDPRLVDDFGGEIWVASVRGVWEAKHAEPKLWSTDGD